MTAPVSIPLVIGVAGHRDLVADELPRLKSLVRGLLQELAQAHPHTPILVASQLAEGADLLVAAEADALGHELICLLPLPLAEYREQFSSPDELARFDALYARSRVVDLTEEATANGALDECDTEEARRDRQYEVAGRFLARYCYVLLALWDGQPADRRGSTAAVVDYRLASRGGARPAVPGRPDLVLGEADNSLVYHIPVSRARTSVSPPAGSPALGGGYVHEFAGGPSARESAMPDTHRLVLQRTDEFNADLGTASVASLRAADAAGTETGRFRAIAGADAAISDCGVLLQAADRLADHFRRRMSRALVLTFALGGIMGGAFVLYSKLVHFGFLIYVFVLMAFAGLAIHRHSEHRGWHRRHLEYRALAEGLRVLFYWRVAGVHDDGHLHTGADSFLRRQDPELEWIRNAMRAVDLTLLRTSSAGIAGGIGFVAEDWIGQLKGGATGGSGQLAYYWRSSERKMTTVETAEKISRVALWAGLSAAVVLCFAPLLHDEVVKQRLVILMGLLPLVSGIVEAYLQKSADRELARQYSGMYQLFDEADSQLRAADSPADKREILRALGRAALAEHSAWVLMHRDRKLRHFAGH